MATQGNFIFYNSAFKTLLSICYIVISFILHNIIGPYIILKSVKSVLTVTGIFTFIAYHPFLSV